MIQMREDDLMTSDDAKYMEEFGPRVVALLDRLQKAAGVGELRTRADLDILAADNVPEPLDRTSIGRVLPQRNVRSRLIIIARVFCKDSPKVLSIEHQQMVRALAPDRANQAFDVSVLPRRSERRGPVPDSHRPDASLEHDAKCFGIIANEIFRRAVPWKGFSDLPRQPLRRRIAGHRKPQQLPPIEAENQKRE